MNQYTTNQLIGSTVGNTPIFSTGTNPPPHIPFIAESGCEHKFIYSHQAQEERGVQGIYQTVIYVICPKCGLVKYQF